MFNQRSSFGGDSGTFSSFSGFRMNPSSTENNFEKISSASGEFAFNTKAPVFGGSAFNTKGTIFGGSASQSQQTSLFGKPTNNTSVFGQAIPSEQTSLFGKPTNSVFGQAIPSEQTSLFGKPTNNTSVFGQANPYEYPTIGSTGNSFNNSSGGLFDSSSSQTLKSRSIFDSTASNATQGQIRPTSSEFSGESGGESTNSGFANSIFNTSYNAAGKPLGNGDGKEMNTFGNSSGFEKNYLAARKNRFTFGVNNASSDNDNQSSKGNSVDVSASFTGESDEGNSSKDEKSESAIKFKPIEGFDTMVRGGANINIQTKFNVVTIMKEFEHQSIEELRLLDYEKGLKNWTNYDKRNSFLSQQECLPKKKEASQGFWPLTNKDVNEGFWMMKELKPQSFKFGFENDYHKELNISSSWNPNPGSRSPFGNNLQENKSIFDNNAHESKFHPDNKSQDNPSIFGLNQSTVSTRQQNAKSCRKCNSVMSNALDEHNRGEDCLFKNYQTNSTNNWNKVGGGWGDDAIWKPLSSQNQSREFIVGNCWKTGEVKYEVLNQMKPLYNELKGHMEIYMHKMFAEIIRGKDERIAELEGEVKALELEKEYFRSNAHPSQLFGASARINDHQNIDKRSKLMGSKINNIMKELTKSFNLLRDELYDVRIENIEARFDCEKKDFFRGLDLGESEKWFDLNKTSETVTTSCDLDEFFKDSQKLTKQFEEVIKSMKINANKSKEKSEDIDLKCTVSLKDVNKDFSIPYVFAKNICESIKTLLEKDESFKDMNAAIKNLEKEMINIKNSEKTKQKNLTPKPNFNNEINTDQNVSTNLDFDIEFKNALKVIQDDVRTLKTNILPPVRKEDDEQSTDSDWQDLRLGENNDF